MCVYHSLHYFMLCGTYHISKTSRIEGSVKKRQFVVRLCINILRKSTTNNTQSAKKELQSCRNPYKSINKGALVLEIKKSKTNIYSKDLTLCTP